MPALEQVPELARVPELALAVMAAQELVRAQELALEPVQVRAVLPTGGAATAPRTRATSRTRRGAARATC